MLWELITFLSVFYMLEIIHRKRVNKRDNSGICSLESFTVRQRKWRFEDMAVMREREWRERIYY